MRPSRPYVHTTAAVLGLCLFLLGCAQPKPFSFDMPSALTAEKKIPLRVGLYLSPKFDTLKKEGLKGWGKFGDEIIEAARVGAKSLPEMVFAETVPLMSLEAARSRGDLDAVVIPEIDYIKFWKGTKSVSVSMSWTVQDPAGKVLYQNTFIGRSHSPSGLSTFANEALEDHFRQAFGGLTTTPWWKGLKEKGS